MNKAETMKDARRMLESAEARFIRACHAVGTCLTGEAGPYEDQALNAALLLNQCKDRLETMRAECRFKRGESAVSVRNSWMHVLFQDARIRETLNEIDNRYIKPS